MKLAPAIFIALVALSIAVDASAARVRFVSDAGDTFDRRIVAEIESVGFEVERPEAREAALLADTVAIVSVLGEPPSVEVWLVDTQGNATLSTVIERDPSAATDTDTTRVAERLRALLQPLAARQQQQQPLPVPPPPRREPEPQPAPLPEPVPRAPVVPAPVDRGASTEASRSRFGIGMAGAALSQPGGIAVSVLVGARYEALPPFGFELFVAMPITKTRLHEADASAELDARLAGIGAHVHVLPPESDWSLRIGGGCGIGWLTAIGEADPPRRGRTENAFVALPFARLDVARRLTSEFSITLGALAALSFPRADLELAGEHTGTWGRPLVLAHLGLGYDP
jgi:hypothetical protein